MNEPEMALFEVFVRSRRGLDHKHVGSVYAQDHEQALTFARDCYVRRGEGVSLWIVRSSDIVASRFEDVETFYDPMVDKEYRHATHYVMPEGIKNL